jgi:hypothetical protein
MSERPSKELTPAVYSNFDHELDFKVATQLIVESGEAYSQHAAWNFCGHIWHDGTQWVEEVWVYKSLVETLRNDDLRALIDEVNFNYGES